MLSCFDFIREMSGLSILIRMLLALVCGGIIGIEREFKRRPAGFRTHILICLGAAMTTMTSQYMALVMGMFTDVARLGAQVIAGIGFIGAGSIIVTRRQRVKGLTTAAGLWTAAIIGLVCGAGYVECAVGATALVMLAELLLIKLEYSFTRRITDVNLYVEYRRSECIERIIRLLKEKRVPVNSLEVTRIGDTDKDEHYYCSVISILASRKRMDGGLSEALSALEDVITVEEL